MIFFNTVVLNKEGLVFMISWIGLLIIACEIGFWIFVISGLVARYIFMKKKLSSILLICTPLVDIILLVATYIDLLNGAVADFIHGLAAIYIGVSVAFGKQMIAWADRQFAYRFAGAPRPKKNKKIWDGICKGRAKRMVSSFTSLANWWWNFRAFHTYNRLFKANRGII